MYFGLSHLCIPCVPQFFLAWMSHLESRSPLEGPPRHRLMVIMNNCCGAPAFWLWLILRGQVWNFPLAKSSVSTIVPSTNYVSVFLFLLLHFFDLLFQHCCWYITLTFHFHARTDVTDNFYKLSLCYIFFHHCQQFKTPKILTRLTCLLQGEKSRGKAVRVYFIWQ